MELAPWLARLWETVSSGAALVSTAWWNVEQQDALHVPILSGAEHDRARRVWVATDRRGRVWRMVLLPTRRWHKIMRADLLPPR